jgi:hypothetical protein
MKPVIVHRDIQTSGVTHTQKMQIAEGQEAVIFNILRKKLYSDKPTSIFREYLSNALDEHVRLNKRDTPFKVTFPNSLSPTLKIRDYGRGLTKEQTFHFFGQFGASDKRDSNELIGQFGLGNKVAHAYTDSYSVTSYLNGVKRIFNCLIDEDERGKIVQLGDDFPTNEPNGVEIAISIEPKDISEFVTKGLKVLKYFPKPIIEGLSYEPKFDDHKLIAEGTGWRFYSGDWSTDAVCLMGSIAYDIDKHAMGYLTNVESQLLNSNLHIDVAIGDVEVTASRESLEMTDKTREAIKARLKVVHDEMLDVVKADFAKATTEFEVRKLYWETIQNGYGYGTILRQGLGEIEWNGKKIGNNIIHFELAKARHRIITYTRAYSRRRNAKIRVNSDSHERVICTQETQDSLYFDDKPDDKVINYSRRAITLINNGVQQVHLLDTADVTEFEAITGLKVENLRKFSEVVPTVPARQVRGGNGVDLAKRKKHQTQVFKLDLAQLNSHNSANSDNWTVENLDLDEVEGVYINIDRFQPVKSVARNTRELRDILNNLAIAGVTTDVSIYGMKPKVTDFGNLQHFDEWLKETVEAIPNIKEDVGLALERHSSNFSLNVTEDKLTGKAKEYVKLTDKINDLHFNGNIQSKRWLLTKVGIEIEKTKQLETLKLELFSKFPLLKYIQQNSYAHRSSEVLAYLNAEPEIIEQAEATETRCKTCLRVTDPDDMDDENECYDCN